MCMYACVVVSHQVMSDSCDPMELPRLLCQWDFRQEYWGRLLFPSPGNLLDPGVEPRSPALWADSLLTKPPGKPSSVP